MYACYIAMVHDEPFHLPPRASKAQLRHEAVALGPASILLRTERQID